MRLDDIAREFRRDAAVKQRILARSPQLCWAVDAQELGAMSGKELAARELKELGIEVGGNDPLALLDAHHSGRQWARDIPGGKLTGGKLIGGSASDSASGSFIDKYLEE